MAKASVTAEDPMWPNHWGLIDRPDRRRLSWVWAMIGTVILVLFLASAAGYLTYQFHYLKTTDTCIRKVEQEVIEKKGPPPHDDKGCVLDSYFHSKGDQ